jgi:tRNA threonylcarbamoyladenosine biosynthesis protein TsaB
VILSIETSTSNCSVALHDKGELVSNQSYNLPKSHSSLLPAIIDQLLVNSEIEKKELKAISVSGGPGSYTGLRIGVSTAKGIAYALNIPLISVSTLEVLAQNLSGLIEPDSLVLPMLDARRMEVYLAVLDHNLQYIQKDQPFIIDVDSFSEYKSHKLFLWRPDLFYLKFESYHGG